MSLLLLTEVLTRDRLLGMYETKPVLQKLRVTLIGSGALLLLTATLLFGLIKADTDSDGMYGRGAARGPRQVCCLKCRVSAENHMCSCCDDTANKLH